MNWERNLYKVQFKTDNPHFQILTKILYDQITLKLFEKIKRSLKPTILAGIKYLVSILLIIRDIIQKKFTPKKELLNSKLRFCLQL